MRTIVVYKPVSEHARKVEEFLHDFTHQTGKSLETVDPDSKDGSAFCETYDIVSYPTVIAVDDDSRMVQVWEGESMPRISEVSYYVE